MRAAFRRKETELDVRECVIEKMILLPENEYRYFTKHMCSDYDFIRENKELMKVKGDVWHCILVAGEESREGVLVESEGADYARYSAFVPDAGSYIQELLKSTQEAECMEALQEQGMKMQ